MEALPHSVKTDRLFAGNSEVERLLRGIDWGQHAIGQVSQWPTAPRYASA